MMRQMWTDGAPASLLRTVEFLAVSLFVVCMVCHGELARLKPHPRHLTGFYVIVSLGGAMGGLFVGLAAPNLFRAYYEFPLGLGICAAVLALVCLREAWTHPAYIRYAAAAVADRRTRPLSLGRRAYPEPADARLSPGRAQFLRPAPRPGRWRSQIPGGSQPHAGTWNHQSRRTVPARRIPPAAGDVFLSGVRRRPRHARPGRRGPPHRSDRHGLRHARRLRQVRRHATHLRDQPLGVADRAYPVHLPARHAGQARCRHG